MHTRTKSNIELVAPNNGMINAVSNQRVKIALQSIRIKHQNGIERPAHIDHEAEHSLLRGFFL